jgi:hypothetical protein
MARGRCKKTLLERVIDRSFRPERYRDLLDGPLLPEELPPEISPARVDPFYRPINQRRVWKLLRKWQENYQVETRWYREHEPKYELNQARAIASEFAQLMHHLHGGRQPSWYEDLV